jgi:hypothetical protein
LNECYDRWKQSVQIHIRFWTNNLWNADIEVINLIFSDCITLEIMTAPYETSVNVYQPTRQNTIEYFNISAPRPLESQTLLRIRF